MRYSRSLGLAFTEQPLNALYSQSGVNMLVIVVLHTYDYDYMIRIYNGKK